MIWPLNLLRGMSLKSRAELRFYKVQLQLDWWIREFSRLSWIPVILSALIVQFCQTEYALSLADFKNQYRSYTHRFLHSVIFCDTLSYLAGKTLCKYWIILMIFYKGPTLIVKRKNHCGEMIQSEYLIFSTLLWA